MIAASSYSTIPYINNASISYTVSVKFTFPILSNTIGLTSFRRLTCAAAASSTNTNDDDYYKTLNVGKNASLQDIKTSYRSLARKVSINYPS